MNHFFFKPVAKLPVPKCFISKQTDYDFEKTTSCSSFKNALLNHEFEISFSQRYARFNYSWLLLAGFSSSGLCTILGSN